MLPRRIRTFLICFKRAKRAFPRCWSEAKSFFVCIPLRINCNDRKFMHSRIEKASCRGGRRNYAIIGEFNDAIVFTLKSTTCLHFQRAAGKGCTRWNE